MIIPQFAAPKPSNTASIVRLCLSRIENASRNISPIFLQTPQYICEPLSELLGCEITLKIETLNPIRCFKGRGTELAISRAIHDGHTNFVCASAGNLGQAVAFSSRARNTSCTVVASRDANAGKLKRISDLGATLQLVDGDIELARETARQIAESGPFLIEDSENLATCEGAATIGLELTGCESESYDAVLVALGGGALATGVGYVVKQRCPTTKLVCVQPRGAPAMTLSWQAKTVVQTDTIETIADGVAGRFPIPEVLGDLIEIADDALLVDESSIVRGIRLLYQHAGLVVEPSAALGIAALLENPGAFRGKKIATIICGSNILTDDFLKWVGHQNAR